jgi:hypothetical protein
MARIFCVQQPDQRHRAGHLSRATKRWHDLKFLENFVVLKKVQNAKDVGTNGQHAVSEKFENTTVQ